MKNKKLTGLWIALISVDVGLTLFFFVIHIIMLAQTVGKTSAEIQANAAKNGLIGYLQTHTTFYLWVFVIPLFVILAANIVGLVLYVRKSTKKEQVKVDNLTDEQRAALRRELLQDLAKEQEAQEAPKAEEKAPEDNKE